MFTYFKDTITTGAIKMKTQLDQWRRMQVTTLPKHSGISWCEAEDNKNT